MGRELIHSVKKVSYGGLEEGAWMLAQIFQELFFDYVGQKVDGLLILDNKLDFLAGNERGMAVCKYLFPLADAVNTSCIRTAQIIKKNFQLGYFQFDVESRNHDGVFDFSLLPKTLGQDKSLNCYLCTVEEKGTASQTNRIASQYYGLLTKRQIEVVELMAAGMSNREIAEKLTISEHTVHKHLENVREKLGVNNRVGIVNKLNLMYS